MLCTGSHRLGIEDGQKTLFEKKKFALAADCLAPIQHIPETLRAEVLSNRSQTDQWKDWYSIKPKKDLFNQKGEINHTFLDQHPTLPVDTRCFDPVSISTRPCPSIPAASTLTSSSASCAP